MKRLLNISILLLTAGSSIAQTNLVPNSSFEVFTSCPTIGTVTYSTSWYDARYSPDYYNSCNPNSNSASVPSNMTGYQLARTGNAYAGFLAYMPGGGLSREWIGVELNDSMIVGRKYCVEFYISLANTSQYACDGFEVYFSPEAYVNNNIYPLSYPPQLTHPSGNIISDTANWVRVSWSYLAIGGEKFMTIGNFKNDANTTTLQVSQQATGMAYYYIEDVSVICCDSSGCEPPQPPLPSPPTESSIIAPNVFTPNGDGINDVFKIQTTAITEINCTIVDRWGIKVAELKRIEDHWDGRTTSGQEATPGVYYYIIAAKGEDRKEYNENGVIQLIK